MRTAHTAAPGLARALAAGFALVVAAAACSDPPGAVDYPSEIVYLNQGWSNLDRQTYYYTAQGTELHGLRYEWLRFLETPMSKDRFADPANLQRFGFLYDPEQLLPDYDPPPFNPGNFPVGFAHHVDELTGESMVDITCAACHTGQIELGDVAIRIDGGPGMHQLASTDPDQFVPQLVLALIATYSNPFKFDRFAKNVLGLRYPQDKRRLHEQLGRSIDGFAVEGWQIAKDHLFPVKEGYGRIDALTHISATVFGSDLDPENFRQGTAPVSYPHVWDIWKFDWVQWNASVAQPMARNVGEALGVKARLDLVDEVGRPLPPDSMYRSSVLVPELHCIETTLWKLGAPIWDETVLPPIDTAKVALGRRTFEEICAHCHGPNYYDSRTQQETPYKPIEWKVTFAELWEVGTDPEVVNNFLDYRYDASGLDPGNPDLKSIDAGRALELVTQAVIERKYRELGVDSAQRWELDGWGRTIETLKRRGYKARPLHGIWATAPFLHNGSVPTLYHMLVPEEHRPTRFWVGTRQFDPVRVGFVQDDSTGERAFLFDTSIRGNHNRGHQFRDDGGAGVIGRGLTEEERWGIIEFLKVFGTRPEDFGTPPEGYYVPTESAPIGYLTQPACDATLQSPSAYPRFAQWADTTEERIRGMVGVADSMKVRAYRRADSANARPIRLAPHQGGGR